MAGGEGTRLRPITSLRPKPMVPIVNQPVMEHIIGLVKHHGIDEVVATLAFMPRTIQDYFGAGEEWGVEIGYAVEESPLGTAGSVKNAQHLLGTDEPFLIISGDAVTDIDLTEVLNFHKERGGAVTIALKRVSDPLDFGVVITAEDGLVERFLEKPSWGQVFSDTINTGIYVIEPWVLDYIPEGEPYDFSADLFPRLMEDGHEIYGIAVEGYWCDVGSRESYMQVHRDILDGLVKVFIPGIHAREGLWVSESARIDDTATLGTGVVHRRERPRPLRGGHRRLHGHRRQLRYRRRCPGDPLRPVERHVHRQAVDGRRSGTVPSRRPQGARRHRDGRGDR